MSIELSEMSASIKALTEAARPPAAFPRTTEPPTYDGVRDAMVIDSWIRSVNRYAKFHEWVDERKLSYAITLLRGRLRPGIVPWKLVKKYQRTGKRLKKD